MQKFVSNYLVNSPAPLNLSYFWNFGSLLGVVLVTMIVSGVSLAMHYTPNTTLAFDSVEHIMRSVNLGWTLRYIHANGATFFFLLVYLHIGRNLFYGSYQTPRALLWLIGVVIFVVMMATAFLGYLLPFGQMSLWGATVITNLFSVVPFIGDQLLLFLWGGFSVANPTFNRFFSLHYLLPFVLAFLVLLHLMALHSHGSNNPTGLSSQTDKLRFHPYFTYKDLVTVFLLALVMGVVVFYAPNYFGHPDNSIKANPLVTPHSIVPEWYFLPFYAILRALPSKTGGVIAMALSLGVLALLPFIRPNTSRSSRFNPIGHYLFWIFACNFLFLLCLGSMPIAQPYIILGQLSTIIYFTYFILLALLTYYLL